MKKSNSIIFFSRIVIPLAMGLHLLLLKYIINLPIIFNLESPYEFLLILIFPILLLNLCFYLFLDFSYYKKYKKLFFSARQTLVIKSFVNMIIPVMIFWAIFTSATTPIFKNSTALEIINDFAAHTYGKKGEPIEKSNFDKKEKVKSFTNDEKNKMAYTDKYEENIETTYFFLVVFPSFLGGYSTFIDIDQYLFDKYKSINEKKQKRRRKRKYGRKLKGKNN